MVSSEFVRFATDLSFTSATFKTAINIIFLVRIIYFEVTTTLGPVCNGPAHTDSTVGFTVICTPAGKTKFSAIFSNLRISK